MQFGKFILATLAALIALTFSALSVYSDPYPPVDQKRPPIMLKAHGIFWAGGQIVNRTQSGTQNAGDLKNVPYNQQQYLVGQAYVEDFIPQKLRNGKNTLPIVMVPGGALVGVHFLPRPTAAKVGLIIFCGAVSRSTSSMCPAADGPASCRINSMTSKPASLSRIVSRC